MSGWGNTIKDAGSRGWDGGCRESLVGGPRKGITFEIKKISKKKRKKKVSLIVLLEWWSMISKMGWKTGTELWFTAFGHLMAKHLKSINQECYTEPLTEKYHICSSKAKMGLAFQTNGLGLVCGFLPNTGPRRQHQKCTVLCVCVLLEYALVWHIW